MMRVLSFFIVATALISIGTAKDCLKDSLVSLVIDDHMCHTKLHWYYLPLSQRFDFQLETRLLGIAALLSRSALV